MLVYAAAHPLTVDMSVLWMHFLPWRAFPRAPIKQPHKQSRIFRKRRMLLTAARTVTHDDVHVNTLSVFWILSYTRSLSNLVERLRNEHTISRECVAWELSEALSLSLFFNLLRIYKFFIKHRCLLLNETRLISCHSGRPLLYFFPPLCGLNVGTTNLSSAPERVKAARYSSSRRAGTDEALLRATGPGGALSGPSRWVW